MNEYINTISALEIVPIATIRNPYKSTSIGLKMLVIASPDTEVKVEFSILRHWLKDANNKDNIILHTDNYDDVLKWIMDNENTIKEQLQ